MFIRFDENGNLIGQPNAKLPVGITHNYYNPAQTAYNAKAKEGGLIGTFLTIEEAVSARESFTGHVRNVTFNTQRRKWVVRHNHGILGEFNTQKAAIKAKLDYAESRALYVDAVAGINQHPT